MKSSLSLVLLLTAMMGSSIQSVAQEMTEQDFLKQSKNQKKTGTILLGSGVLLTGVGFLLSEYNSCDVCNQVQSQENAGTVGAILFATGGVLIISSVLVFTSANKNARLAEKLRLYSQTIDLPQRNSKLPTRYPAISISIRIN